MSQKGRPKAEVKRDVTIRCRITSELNEHLEKYCKDKQTTKSAVMVDGIKKTLEE